MPCLNYFQGSQLIQINASVPCTVLQITMVQPHLVLRAVLNSTVQDAFIWNGWYYCFIRPYFINSKAEYP